jgi:hypothetical protein
MIRTSCGFEALSRGEAAAEPAFNGGDLGIDPAAMPQHGPEMAGAKLLVDGLNAASSQGRAHPEGKVNCHAQG